MIPATCSTCWNWRLPAGLRPLRQACPQRRPGRPEPGHRGHQPPPPRPPDRPRHRWPGAGHPLTGTRRYAYDAAELDETRRPNRAADPCRGRGAPPRYRSNRARRIEHRPDRPRLRNIGAVLLAEHDQLQFQPAGSSRAARPTTFIRNAGEGTISAGHQPIVGELSGPARCSTPSAAHHRAAHSPGMPTARPPIRIPVEQRAPQSRRRGPPRRDPGAEVMLDRTLPHRRTNHNGGGNPSPKIGRSTTTACSPRFRRSPGLGRIHASPARNRSAQAPARRRAILAELDQRSSHRQ